MSSTMFRNRSTPRRYSSPSRGGRRARIDRRQAGGCFEWLEERQMLDAAINASSSLHAVATNLLGINMVYWDPDTGTSQTRQMVTAAGLNVYRFPGGSAADDFHFNVADNYYHGAQTFVDFVQAITAAGGTGLVTLDYGSASPQEAAAELAYLDGSPTDATSIGGGIQWNDAAGQWQTVNWGTVGSWAALRGASPLVQDDGLNFMRIAHPAAFTNISNWEVGNEVYGEAWEIDHHGTAGPGGVGTGAAHDPATYAAFAKQFASLAAEIQTAAGLPPIAIGIDSGDPTGVTDGNWTQNVLADGLADGFVPGFISDHSYMQGPGNESDSFLLNDTVSKSGSVLDWSTRYADYQTMLQQTLGSQASSVQVMATEYNSVYANPGKQSTSLVNGLFVADSLGSLLDSGYTGGFVWDLRNSWDTGQNNSSLLYGWREGGDFGQLGDANDLNSAPATGPYVAYPGYYALQLASKIIRNGGQVVPATSDSAKLHVYAVKESSGDLALLVINVDPAASITETFAPTGFQPGGPAQVWQYGQTQDTAQSHSPTGASALANSSTILSLTGSNFTYTFPAYSMTVLDLTANASPIGSQIVDNSEPGFWSSASTTWTTGAGLDGSSLISSTAGGSKLSMAAWWFSMPAGVYDISVAYTAGSNLTTKFGLDLYDGVGNWMGQVQVDERQAPTDFVDQGVGWKRLGSFTLTNNIFHISTWNSAADGAICVDAIQLRAVPLVDDGDVNGLAAGGSFATTGDWTTGTQGAFGGSHTSSSTAGSGASTATWTAPAGAGSFEVDATWAPAAGLSANVTYTIYDGGTKLNTVTVDQRNAPGGVSDEGVAWTSLGTFTIANQLKVTVANAAGDGQVSADAIRIDPAYQPMPIVAMNFPGSWYGGPWTTINSGVYGASLVSTGTNGSKSSMAAWWFPCRPGQYDVQVTWPAGSNLSQNAGFDVYNALSWISQTVIDERNAPSGVTDQGVAWQSLGVFTMTSNVLHVSTWNSPADGPICADGIRIVPVGSLAAAASAAALRKAMDPRVVDQINLSAAAADVPALAVK